MMMNDKDTAQVDDKLEDALALLAAGISVDDILAEAGPDAEWLRPLLAVAEDVGQLQAAVPIPSPEASLQRMLAYGREVAAATPPAAPAQQNWLTAFLSGGWLPRLAAGLASALLLVVLLGGMVTVLAQRSLPGQSLYGLKRAVENVRLSLTLDPQDRAQLLETYNQQRQTEARLLLQQNEVATVSFSGVAEAVSETELTLAGLTLQLTPQTQVKGTLAAGARVEVEAVTQPPDRLTALTVTVIEPAPPTPTPLPSPTSTASPTPTPSPTATATATRSLSSESDILILPTLTPTATPTPAPTDTPTPLPPPTDTPAPPPAASPESPLPGGDNTNEDGTAGPDDNGNDSGNENGTDDNGGGGDNSNDDSGGDDSGGNDNSGSDDSDSGDDNSGSGSDDSGGGGNDNSGGGGNDNSGSGGSNSGSGGGGGGDNDNKSKD